MECQGAMQDHASRLRAIRWQILKSFSVRLGAYGGADRPRLRGGTTEDEHVAGAHEKVINWQFDLPESFWAEQSVGLRGSGRPVEEKRVSGLKRLGSQEHTR